MKWDQVPISDTRPVMKGGVPFWAVFPIFFGPALIVVITWNPFYMFLIPGLWSLFKFMFAKNPNRPREYILWITSGAAMSTWRYWGGVSIGAHGKTSLGDGL